jgi:DNA polymerase-1
METPLFMHHINHSTTGTFDTAILIKESRLDKEAIERYYINPLAQKGMDVSSIVSFSLDYQGKKQSVKNQKEYLDILMPEIDKLGIKDILIADGDYFKTLCKVTKAVPHYGYVMPCKYPGYEHMNVVLVPNYGMIWHMPSLEEKVDIALNALDDHKRGSYVPMGTNIIHSEYYPKSLTSIERALRDLHKHPMLTCDIETFHLKHHSSGLGTIGFAWSKHEGLAFKVDYKSTPQRDGGYQEYNQKVRELLKIFFREYKGKILWHNASFDIYILVYQLWMDGLLDQEGLLEGLHIMTKNFGDTKIITYLATNSTEGNHLSLKEQAHKFAGNYAESEINDITKIPQDRLLRYNLVDCLSTWYVYEKHYGTMVDDVQLDLYNDLFIPSIKTIVQMQLTGMCLDMGKVLEAESHLSKIHRGHYDSMQQSDLIIEFTEHLRQSRMDKDNLSLKTKQRTIDEVAHIVFNPNSNNQLQELLYEVMDLPILDMTKNKKPATGNKTLSKLLNHCTDELHVEFLEHLIGFIKVDKVLTAFIPRFKEAPLAEDGYHYLFGNFNLGGTVSGRLSSSNPNLQQIPSGSTYAKIIKACFVAPRGWIFVGADSASLEDRIDALQTKDPNKLKVYTDGYDGHCLRAFNYFPDRLPGIVDTVESINSIAKLFKDVRQDSKAPTFALTYEGTYNTLMSNCGFTYNVATQIETNYLEMYKHSVQWKADRMEECAKNGYATVAFGLRVRTPMMAKSILGTSVTPYAVAAEGRTVGNAYGQSWGLLNSRAGNEVMGKVWTSSHALNIRPCAQIHDALYFLVLDDDMETLTYLNGIVGEAMAWQDHPAIRHEQVHLSGELDVFYPSWKDDFTLPNGASKEEIIQISIDEAIKRKK